MYAISVSNVYYQFTREKCVYFVIIGGVDPSAEPEHSLHGITVVREQLQRGLGFYILRLEQPWADSISRHPSLLLTNLL